VKRPEAAVLSAEIAGPFKQGKNEEKFMSVAAYTMVKEELTKEESSNPKVKMMNVSQEEQEPSPRNVSKVQELIKQFEKGKGLKEERPRIKMAKVGGYILGSSGVFEVSEEEMPEGEDTFAEEGEVEVPEEDAIECRTSLRGAH